MAQGEGCANEAPGTEAVKDASEKTEFKVAVGCVVFGVSILTCQCIPPHPQTHTHTHTHLP